MKDTEKNRLKPELLINAITDCSIDGIFCKDSEMRYTYVNSTMIKMLGKRESEILGKTYSEIFHDDTTNIIIDMNESVLNGEICDRIVSSNNNTKAGYLHVVETPIYNKDNEIMGIYGTVRDVTEREIERQNKENEILESEERYRTLSEISSIGIIIHDMGKVILGNNASVEMFGYKKDELIGKNVIKIIIAPECREYLLGQIKKDVLAPYEITAVKKNGTRFPIEIRGSKIRLKGKDLRLVTMTDITERKEVDQLMQLQMDLSIILSSAIGLDQVLSCLLEHTFKIDGIDSGGIYLLDKDSEKLELILSEGLTAGFTESVTTLNKSTPQYKLVIKGDSLFLNHSNSKMAAKKYENEGLKKLALIPFKYKNKVIGCLNLASHVEKEFTENEIKTMKSISGIIGGAVSRAKTEEALLESEDKLRHSDKMQAIGQLAGGIAHDFNNQLAGIVGFADLLSEELHYDSRLKKYADNILTSANRASDLTSQLLAFARKGRYKSVQMDIHSRINEVINMLSHSIDKRIIITKEFNSVDSVIMGDPTQIQNAILNIALNARDAMPSGGELRFITKKVIFNKKRCKTEEFEIEPGEYINICISDTGIGMEPEIRNRMFEPFFTTKDFGTGMGMAAVYGTVENHNGTLKVSTEQGKGTEIDLFFPLSKDPIKTVSKDRQDYPLIKENINILFVDDEETVCKIAGSMLESLGYNICLCKNGKEAVEYYKKNRNIDLIILDIIMPVMNGKDAFKEIIKINPDAKVLISSGYSISEETQDMLEMGVSDFIQKPYRKNILARKISEILGK